MVKETQYDVRYALNFCTYSYTMAFWGWEEYEPFLDWCAMNGINIMLDIVGQEEVQRRLLTKYNYTDEEVKNYISGPGYFAWFYMDNMSNFGGPLPDSWFEQRVELGRQIHDRMQVFGIQPVMQGFAGQVPTDFTSKNPDAAVIAQGNWCGFVRPYMLRTYNLVDGTPQPTDYFNRMSEDFYQIQKDVFGDVTDYYAVDPFHEGGNAGDMSLPLVYQVVQRKMLEADPNAHWVLMQWQGQITNEKISNLADPSRALILDLQADLRSYSSVMEANGTPWIWCMLHNFGGRMGVDGDIITVSQDIPVDYQNSQYMVGIGITPEAFGNSPVVYDLLFDMTWTRDPIDYNQWVEDYVESRYGSADENLLNAWNTLLDTTYGKKTTYYQGAGETVICDEPSESFNSASTWGHSNFQYDTEEFEQALLDFIAAYDAHSGNEAFLYDMVDVTKQVLATAAIDYHKLMIQAYREQDLAEFKKISGQFLDLIQLMDDVLACSGDFTVGKWLKDARDMYPGMDDWTKDLFEFNARALITTWGGGSAVGGGLLDYSNRQWAGLVEDYYLPRWEDFVERYTTALETGTSPVSKNYFLQEWEWVNRKSDEGDGYESISSGEDLKALAQRAYDEFSLTNLDAFLDSEAESVNIAKDKIVTSSLETAAGNLSDLTDENVTTTWKAATAGEVTLTVDLGGTYTIDEIAFDLPNVAGNYPWDFAIRVYTDSGWEMIDVEQVENPVGKISVACQITGSQVEYTFTPKVDAGMDLTAEFAELWVYGEEVQEDLGVNIASAGAISATSERDIYPVENLVDGNRGTFWTSVEGATFPVTVTLDFEEDRELNQVVLAFHPDHQIELLYTLEVFNKAGALVASQTYNEDTPHAAVMELPVGTAGSKIVLTFTGRTNGSICDPGATELEVYAKEESPDPEPPTTTLDGNIAPKGTVTASKERESVQYMVDGDRTNFWSTGDGNYPAWVEIDFGMLRDITSVNLVFVNENQIKQKHKIELLGEDGTTVVAFFEDSSDAPKDMVCEIDVSGNVRYVRMTLLDKTAGSGCWPGAAELEVYGKPLEAPIASGITTTDETLAGQDLKGILLDGSSETSVSLPTSPVEFELTYESAFDLSALELVGDNGMAFEAFYFSENGEWVSLGQSTTVEGAQILSLDQPVLTDAIKLVVTGSELSSINVYRYDYKGEFLGYLDGLCKSADAYTVGDMAGNIPQEAKDAFDKEMNALRAGAAGGVSSTEIDELKKQADNIFRTLERSVIYMDRGNLTVALSDAQWFANNGFNAVAASLADDIAAAMAVYNAPDVTQSDLDSAANLLAAATAGLRRAAQALVWQMDAANALLNDPDANITESERQLLSNAIGTAKDAVSTAATEQQLDAACAALKRCATRLSRCCLFRVLQYPLLVAARQKSRWRTELCYCPPQSCRITPPVRQ